MFCTKLIILFLMVYGILFITGWGICVHICRGKNEAYRFLLSPIIGILPLSIIPIYFSLLGVETAIGGWVSFVLFSCFSLYSIVKTPVGEKIRSEHVFLLLFMLVAATPVFIIILRAGYLTSTLTSYAAFTTIPADYFIHNTVSQKVLVDFDRPITYLLSELINRKEYFGFFFLIASMASIIHIPPHKLYLVLSAVIGSLVPISAFIASKEGFKVSNRVAVCIAFMTCINYSYFVWPAIGQMPMIAGLVYLILFLGFLPSILHCQKGVDYILYSALIAGGLSLYPVFICYVFGAFGFYSLYHMRKFGLKSLSLKTMFKLALATSIINPFTFIFFGLNGAEAVTTTSNFTKNIPGYPNLEGLFGFGEHFGVIQGGSIQEGFFILVVLLALLFVCAGCYERLFKSRDHLFISISAFMVMLGVFFYLIDFTYHFYKNAIIGVFMLIASLVIGADWVYHKMRFGALKILAGAICTVFVILNIHTLVEYSLTSHRLINKSLTHIEQLSAIVPTDTRILINSYDPTEEAWISYFLRRNKIKLTGAIEPWGFWILSPFSGKPNPNFFYDPYKDVIDYTLLPKPRATGDIAKIEYGEIIYKNDDHILSKNVPSPLLFKGWYKPDKNYKTAFRWTDQVFSLIAVNSGEHTLLHVKGTIPSVYADPLGISVYLNGSLIDSFYAGPSTFNKVFLLTKNARNLVSFVLDHSFRPNETANSTDLRSLGIMVNHIDLIPADEMRTNGLIDVGVREYDKFLRSGWSHNELMGGRSYAWVEGEKASLNIFVDQLEEMIMEFRANLFYNPRAALHKTDIYVNDRFIGSVAMDHNGWPVYNIKIPSHAWKKGINIIEFMFESCAKPAEVLENSSDLRCLSAAFDYVKFFGTTQDASEQ